MGLGDPFPGIPSHLRQFTAFPSLSSRLLSPSFVCTDHWYGMLVCYYFSFLFFGCSVLAQPDLGTCIVPIFFCSSFLSLFFSRPPQLSLSSKICWSTRVVQPGSEVEHSGSYAQKSGSLVWTPRPDRRSMTRSWHWAGLLPVHLALPPDRPSGGNFVFFWSFLVLLAAQLLGSLVMCGWYVFFCLRFLTF